MKYKIGDIYVEKCEKFLGVDDKGYVVIHTVTKNWKIVAVSDTTIIGVNDGISKVFENR